MLITKKRGYYEKKGRENRDGVHKATDLNMRTPPTPSHNPYTVG